MAMVHDNHNHGRGEGDRTERTDSDVRFVRRSADSYGFLHPPTSLTFQEGTPQEAAFAARPAVCPPKCILKKCSRPDI